MLRHRLLHLHKRLPCKTLHRHTSQVASTIREQQDSGLKELDKLQDGTQVEGFILVRKQEIKEFRLTAGLFLHEKTKAQYLHLFRYLFSLIIR